MSDGSLSQDEIDALLQGSTGMDLGGSSAPAGGGAGGEPSPDDLQAFGALLKGTVESQQSNLSMLTSAQVSMTGPELEMSDPSSIAASIGDPVVQLHLNFSEGVDGVHRYLMSSDAAVRIAGAMMGQDDIELDDAALNALQEAFSQLNGPVLTTLGEKADKSIMTEPPSAESVGGNEVSGAGERFVAARYSVTIGSDAPAEIYELFDPRVIPQILGSSSAAQQAASQQAQQPQQAGAPGGFGQGGFGQQAGFGQGAGFGGGQQAAGFGGGPSVQSVQFPDLQQSEGPSEQGNIGLLMDVYMEMTVELGRTKKLIREILGMGEGTIIELDKLAGEPVDILVNHKLIAKGEVVVIDENFGVRVTEIVSPMERVSNMT